ncbi:Do family serine endopeptidase [Methylocapsa polymorpha]|uniref:Probable periplasmic serine endoprotease DegP-like n=1 Tax=Methylocapsa polymorpha TaxID=3080828 RepID=A0ABZ0HPP4_9HYPH|nr:Do family serine endopeptidase [Methylocapsa sp. RX1]
MRGAVVSVKVKITETGEADEETETPHVAPGDPLERFFKRFGEEGGGLPFEQHGKPHSTQAQGSGFIISSDGYVVTNNHVVDHATDVSLTMDDGKIVPATVVGVDKKTDLALLKIKDSGTYPHVDFSSATPRVGEWVIAVGNPFGLGGTVTAGIVSARGRDIGAGPYDDFLQIDAPVNRGNSGGPTFNGQGQVVGVNTAIFSPSGGSVGIGFAIPADTVQNVVASLKNKGLVDRGWIGVKIQPVTPEIADSLGLKSSKGALVAEAQSDSPATAAGIASGDVILGIDGERIDGPRDLARKVAALGPGKKADLAYWHNGAEKTVSVKLGSLPEDKEARANPAVGQDNSAFVGLGLKLAPASSVQGAGSEGVVVADIDPDGAAAQKGLRVGDVILEAGGHAVNRPAEVKSILAEAKKDGRKAVLLRVKNGEGTRFVAIATNPAS